MTTAAEFDQYLKDLLAECQACLDEDREITIGGNGTNSFEAIGVIEAIKEKWDDVVIPS